MAWVWLGQALTWLQVAGAVVTLSAVIYLQRLRAATPERVEPAAHETSLRA